MIIESLAPIKVGEVLEEIKALEPAITVMRGGGRKHFATQAINTQPEHGRFKGMERAERIAQKEASVARSLAQDALFLWQQGKRRQLRKAFLEITRLVHKEIGTDRVAHIYVARDNMATLSHDWRMLESVAPPDRHSSNGNDHLNAHFDVLNKQRLWIAHSDYTPEWGVGKIEIDNETPMDELGEAVGVATIDALDKGDVEVVRFNPGDAVVVRGTTLRREMKVPATAGDKVPRLAVYQNYRVA